MESSRSKFNFVGYIPEEERVFSFPHSINKPRDGTNF
jgi:hypothetical protein